MNNNELNNIITESKSNTDEKKEKIEPRNKYSHNNINNNIKKEILTSASSIQDVNHKRKIITKNKSNEDLMSIPISLKLNQKNYPNIDLTKSEIFNLNNRNNRLYNRELVSDTKIKNNNNVYMNPIEREYNNTMEKDRNANNINKNIKVKNHSPKDNKNINIIIKAIKKIMIEKCMLIPEY